MVHHRTAASIGPLSADRDGIAAGRAYYSCKARASLSELHAGKWMFVEWEHDMKDFEDKVARDSVGVATRSSGGWVLLIE